MEKNFLRMVLGYEQEGINRQALMLLIKPEIEAIDEKRKAMREVIANDVKSLGAIDAVKACNAICPTLPGADNAARQRLSRRRNWLKSVCEKQFSDYDFSLVDGSLFCVWIGDASVREAKKIHATLARLATLDLDMSSTVEEIAGMLRQEKTTNDHISEQLNVTTETIGQINQVFDRVAAIQARFAGITTEQAEQAEKTEQVG